MDAINGICYHDDGQVAKKDCEESLPTTILGLSLKYPKYKGVAMGQPEFTASEARLLEKLQKKSLTG